MSKHERFALASLFIVAAVGHLIRIMAQGPADAPGGMTLAGLAPASVALHRAASVRVGRPLGEAERIDLNSASAEEIARLPRVGPGLAKTLVRERTAKGGFGGRAELDEVRGLGPALMAAIEPHITLADTDRVRSRRGYASSPLPPPPAILVGPDEAPKAGKKVVGGPPVRINSATQVELERLPGIGPTKAKAIVAYRQSHGPFAAVSELEKVPGFSRRLVAQLASQVAVP